MGADGLGCESVNSLPDGWREACSRSHNRFLDESLVKNTLEERCSEGDGEPCRFLRAIKAYNNIIVAYVCIFNKCIKRYPTLEDLMELEKNDDSM